MDKKTTLWAKGTLWAKPLKWKTLKRKAMIFIKEVKKEVIYHAVFTYPT